MLILVLGRKLKDMNWWIISSNSFSSFILPLQTLFHLFLSLKKNFLRDFIAVTA